MNDMMLKGLVPSEVTYNYLIDGWCKNGEIDRAMLCLSKMFGKEREANVITYATLVDGLCKFGRPDDALKLWDEMGKTHISIGNNKKKILKLFFFLVDFMSLSGLSILF